MSQPIKLYTVWLIQLTSVWLWWTFTDNDSVAPCWLSRSTGVRELQTAATGSSRRRTGDSTDTLPNATIHRHRGTWITGMKWLMWLAHPLDNIRVMVIVWRLRGNIIRTALCWIVWHNVHSPQHTYMSSSYRSNRLGLSHWDPYTVCRGGCLELYYCNMVEWFWWDSCLIFDDQLVSFSALTVLVWSSGL